MFSEEQIHTTHRQHSQFTTHAVNSCSGTSSFRRRKIKVVFVAMKEHACTHVQLIMLIVFSEFRRADYKQQVQITILL
jgi:hypothetical protein